VHVVKVKLDPYETIQTSQNRNHHVKMFVYECGVREDVCVCMSAVCVRVVCLRMCMV